MENSKRPVCYDDWDNSDIEDQDIMEKEEMHDAEYPQKTSENIDNIPNFSCGRATFEVSSEEAGSPLPNSKGDFKSTEKCNQLFILKNDDNLISIYTELEHAKCELKRIYHTIFDWNCYSYMIHVYEMIDKEYKPSNITYTYQFDHFTLCRTT